VQHVPGVVVVKMKEGLGAKLDHYVVSQRHCRSPPKIVQYHIIEMIKANDMIIFLETWMRPEQEHSLPLPPGYIIVAQSRESDKGMRRPYPGGVAIVMQVLNSIHPQQELVCSRLDCPGTRRALLNRRLCAACGLDLA
jgi:hypothetical protein